MKICRLLTIVAVLVTAVRFVSAQVTPPALPEVISHGNPTYPPLARQARIAGSIRLRIATDGHAVSNVTALEGHPLLVQAATENVRTWKFADHVPGIFEVTFDFRLLTDKTTFLQQPGDVDITVLPPDEEQNSKEPHDYTLPESWDLELKTATDDIKAPLTLWTYGPWLRGYTAGIREQERYLGSPHLDGALLGFDATLDDSHGQRLQFSLVGKKTADKMQGVFLDAWGGSGTWTAAPSKPSASTCTVASPAAEENVIPVPEITQHQQPNYPGLAWEAHIEGQVRMRVSANDYCVAKITTQSSDPLLAQAAEANVRTWLFGFHKPGTFDITFNYRFLRPGVSFLEKPGIVEISDVLPTIGSGPQSGLWNMGGYRSEVWKAQLTSPGGHVQATLQFPYGCCEEGDATDTEGRKEEIKQGHAINDVLGFNTTIRMSNSQPTKVALIGRRRRDDRIEGVFLDESGTPGKWSARLVSHGYLNYYLHLERNAQKFSQALLDYRNRTWF